MKLEDARQHYYDLSAAASNSARQLAFAGIAVVWILATQTEILPSDAVSELRFPLLMFILALGFDLVQYYGASLFWSVFARSKERVGEQEFAGAPTWINYPGILGFWMKGIAVAAGYVPLFLLLRPVLFR